jgi:D-aspartate ligase
MIAGAAVQVPSVGNTAPPRKERWAIPGGVVTGADYRALGIVRSLGRHDIPVWVVKDSDHALATHSKYSRRTLLPPEGNAEARLKFYLDLSKQNGLERWVLFPTEDESLAFVSRFHRELSEAYQVVTPPWESLQWAVNKTLMHRLAGKLGVAQPWTVSPASVVELSTLAFPYPVILKPAQKDLSNSFTIAKAWRVKDRETLIRAYQEAATVMPPELLMVQEVIPGGGEHQFSYTALCRDGKPLVSLTAKRRRQYPAEFGRASTYVETVHDPGLAEPSVRLLDALKLNGLVEIEYKRDPRDEKFKLLDINPRVWGWHTLCARAGVDYPYLLWLLLNGKPLPNVNAHAGVRWVRLGSDLPNAMKEMLRGRVSPVGYVRSFFGGPLVDAVMDGDDVWPGLVEFPLLVDTAAKRLFTHRKI